MAIVEWQESFKTNIDEIDQQHRQLISTICKLEDAIKKGQGQTALHHIFEELVRYTVDHFQTEERIFSIINYPEADKHKAEHNEFTTKVQQFKKDFEEGKAGLTIGMINFLCDWVRNHLKGSDKRYSEFIAQQHQGS